MVSTRRTARQEPKIDVAEHQKSGQTLRKKPIRRTTARKTQDEDQETIANNTQKSRVEKQQITRKAVPQVEQSNAASRPTKKTAVRPQQKKSDATQSVTAPVRSTRSLRTKQAEVVGTEASQPGPLTEVELPRRTRETIAKAPPLSPKKITQVSRIQTRNLRNVPEKASSAKGNAAATALERRAAARKRKVSDENAEIPIIAHVEVEEVEDEIIALRKHSQTPRTSRREEKISEAEPPMSSGPTTPSDSPRPDFDVLRDEGEYRRRGDSQPNFDSEDEDADVRENEASEDELCGPKTPMKRASPSAGTRYLASVQRTVHRAKDALAVPLTSSNTELSYARKRTPQIQEHISSPAVVLTDARMAVTSNSETPSSSKDCDPVHKEDIEDFALNEQTEQDEDEERIRADNQDALSDSDNEDGESTDFEAVHDDVIPERPQDSNETVVIVDDDEDSELPPSPAMQGSEKAESDDTVVIMREQIESNVQSDGGYGDISFYSNAPSPETLVWDNIRQDATIKVDFDAHLSGAWTLPQGEPTEQLDIAAELAHPELVQASSYSDSASIIRTDSGVGEPSIKGISLAETLPDATLNLNDFIDMAALTESTRVIQIPDILTLDQQEIPQSFDNPNTQCLDQLSIVLKELPEETMSDAEVVQGEHSVSTVSPDIVPHYAWPTLAYDARRKSMPAILSRTPVKMTTRPHTSDGASIARLTNPFREQRWARSRANSTQSTPVRSRPSTGHDLLNAKHDTACDSSLMQATVDMTPMERFPKLGCRDSYQVSVHTVAAPTRFRTPAQTPIHRAATAQKPSSSTTAPRMSALRPRRQSGAFNSIEEAIAVSPSNDSNGPATPTPMQTPGERFPRFQPRSNYEEHAKTVAAPKRFQTPMQTPIRRPATVFKPSSLRKVALASSASPTAAQITVKTPLKTPLKAPAMTPAQAPMTPHPAAPLRGVMALVEVFTLEGASASAPFLALLHRLGARTTRAWSERVTHVVFKDGSPTTLQRVRLNNREVEKTGTGTLIHCVNSRWVTDCDTESRRMDEADDAYAVDLSEVPRGGKRRQKSMEPAALLNMNGNVVKDRRASLRRSSLGRSPMKFESPAKKPEITVEVTPKADEAGGKENGTKYDDLSSPVTPAYLAAPDTLIQQTAPINRMRKLGSKAQDRAQNRRLTFWTAGA